jgi:hypothetical protein
MPRKRLCVERLEKVINPVEVMLGMSAKPKKMLESLRLPTKRASGVKGTKIMEPRAQRKPLEKDTPRKVCNLWLSDNFPNSGEPMAPRLLRELHTLIEHVHHGKVRNQLAIT